MSKARQKGTSFETAVVNVLKEEGFTNAERFLNDTSLGDIRNLPVVAECKNHKSLALSEWTKQAEVSGTKAGKLWAVIHHRPRKSTRQAYVTMSLEQWIVLMRAYGESLTS
jgi:hypothetical protein